MNKAIDALASETGLHIGEFTVTGFAYENRFAHRWYIGCDDPNVDKEQVKKIIDETLCKINDDYAVERESALKEVFVEILPKERFIDYLKHMGKYGAMNKFPRVLKGSQLRDWEEFLKK
ncbi:GH3 auxin-responsive promoter [compost metagenome]